MLLLVVLFARAAWDGRAALREGDRAWSRGAHVEAVVSYRRALRWHAPWSPWTVEAARKLETIAKRASERGDDALAVFAWRAVRGSLLASRSLYQPQPERLRQANEQIATLMAHDPVQPAMDRDKSVAVLRAEHLALLTQSQQGVSRGWALLAAIGFFLWIGCVWWSVVLLERRGVFGHFAAQPGPAKKPSEAPHPTQHSASHPTPHSATGETLQEACEEQDASALPRMPADGPGDAAPLWLALTAAISGLGLFFLGLWLA